MGNNSFHYIIQEIHGKDLQSSELNLPQAIKVGIRVIKSLENIHNLGYIHGDIKPNNILSTSGSWNHSKKITLIDFGMSSKYLDDFGVHVANRKVEFKSNQWFASVHAFNGNMASRRDDIICLLYTLVYFLTGYRFIQKHAPTENEIGNFKLSNTPEQFCEGCEYLAPVLEEAYSYGFSDKPNYNKIIFLLKNTLIETLQTPISKF